jgi:hypothetical protein
VDVTAALNNWIGSQPDNVTLSFAANACYRIDGTILLEHRNGLTLDGNNATFKAGADGDSQRRQFWFIGGSDLTVRNLTARGANPYAGTGVAAYSSTHEWQHAFAIEGVQTALLDNVQAYDVYGDFVYLGPIRESGYPYEWARNITVRNSHFERNGRQGFGITGAQDVLIENNYIGDVRWDVFDLELNEDNDAASRISVVNNTTGAARLLWLAASGAYGSIDHIYVAGNTQVGEAGVPVLYVDGPANVRGPFLMENNHFLIHHTSSAVDCHACTGVVIRNNSFEFNRSGQTVVSAINSSGFSIHDNDVRTAGVILDGDAQSMAGAYISGNQT